MHRARCRPEPNVFTAVLCISHMYVSMIMIAVGFTSKFNAQSFDSARGSTACTTDCHRPKSSNSRCREIAAVMKVKDKVCLVTGGTGGLGLAFCHALAVERGARVRRPRIREPSRDRGRGPHCAACPALWAATKRDDAVRCALPRTKRS